MIRQQPGILRRWRGFPRGGRATARAFGQGRSEEAVGLGAIPNLNRKPALAPTAAKEIERRREIKRMALRPAVGGKRSGGSRRGGRCAWLLAGLVAFGLHDRGVGADYDSVAEYKLKAAVLLNLAKFVEWPSTAFGNPEAPFVLGILGPDPFGKLLDGLAQNQTVQGRKLMVQRFASVGEAAGCQLLFISRSERPKLVALLNALRDTPILTVSEADQFAEQGGMVNLVMKDEMVRFEINLAAAEDRGLKISSKVLKYARVVGAKSGTPSLLP